jgi:hypothetical protein
LAEGGREEGPERALDVGLARLPVALKSGWPDELVKNRQKCNQLILWRN